MSLPTNTIDFFRHRRLVKGKYNQIQIISLYNKYIGDIDKFDFLIKMYGKFIRSRK